MAWHSQRRHQHNQGVLLAAFLGSRAADAVCTTSTIKREAGAFSEVILHSRALRHTACFVQCN